MKTFGEYNKPPLFPDKMPNLIGALNDTFRTWKKDGTLSELLGDSEHAKEAWMVAWRLDRSNSSVTVYPTAQFKKKKNDLESDATPYVARKIFQSGKILETGKLIRSA